MTFVGPRSGTWSGRASQSGWPCGFLATSTRSVFDRYDIVSEGDLIKARCRLEVSRQDDTVAGVGWTAVEHGECANLHCLTFGVHPMMMC